MQIRSVKNLGDARGTITSSADTAGRTCGSTDHPGIRCQQCRCSYNRAFRRCHVEKPGEDHPRVYTHVTLVPRSTWALVFSFNNRSVETVHCRCRGGFSW